MSAADDLFSVSGQAVLVTGGSRGIGRAIAEEFSRRGAQVVICSKSQSSVDEAVSQMRTAGMEVEGLVCDVADEQQIDSTVDAVLKLRGRIDTLVNVAGVKPRVVRLKCAKSSGKCQGIWLLRPMTPLAARA